jgi:hypothetical protein
VHRGDVMNVKHDEDEMVTRNVDRVIKMLPNVQ